MCNIIKQDDNSYLITSDLQQAIGAISYHTSNGKWWVEFDGALCFAWEDIQQISQKMFQLTYLPAPIETVYD